MLKPDTEAYIPSVVESKWQKKWKDSDIYKTFDNVPSKKKLVCIINVSLPFWRFTYWPLVCIYSC